MNRRPAIDDPIATAEVIAITFGEAAMQQSDQSGTKPKPHFNTNNEPNGFHSDLKFLGSVALIALGVLAFTACIKRAKTLHPLPAVNSAFLTSGFNR